MSALVLSDRSDLPALPLYEVPRHDHSQYDQHAPDRDRALPRSHLRYVAWIHAAGDRPYILISARTEPVEGEDGIGCLTHTESLSLITVGMYAGDRDWLLSYTIENLEGELSRVAGCPVTCIGTMTDAEVLPFL